MDINIESIAGMLNNTEYDEVLRGAEFKNTLLAVARLGCVVAFGISDDLAEFHGAWGDEFDAYGGKVVYISKGGPIINRCEDEDCPYYKEEIEMGTPIKFVWRASGDYAWTIETDIPHRTFDILEDGEKFSRGIVFSVEELKWN